MSPELEKLLNNTFQLKQTLGQVLPLEAVNYLMKLIANDGAHQKYIKLTEETDSLDS